MRSLRAISPVVATALLIIIAVVTAVVLYMWVSGMVGQQPTQQTKVQEALKSEAVNAVSNGTAWNITTIYVRNVGSVTVNVTDIYIFDARTGQLLNHTMIPNGALIKPGQVVNVTENVTTPISGTKVKGILNIRTNATSLLIKVVTKDGVEATYIITRST
jgi:FlaG/FlaF family flagellin (archaellin)